MPPRIKNRDPLQSSPARLLKPPTGGERLGKTKGTSSPTAITRQRAVDRIQYGPEYTGKAIRVPNKPESLLPSARLAEAEQLRSGVNKPVQSSHPSWTSSRTGIGAHGRKTASKPNPDQQIFVNGPGGLKALSLTKDMTGADIKQQLGLQNSDVRVTYGGMPVRDDRTLREQGIGKLSTLSVQHRLRGGAPEDPPPEAMRRRIQKAAFNGRKLCEVPRPTSFKSNLEKAAAHREPAIDPPPPQPTDRPLTLKAEHGQELDRLDAFFARQWRNATENGADLQQLGERAAALAERPEASENVPERLKDIADYQNHQGYKPKTRGFWPLKFNKGRTLDQKYTDFGWERAFGRILAKSKSSNPYIDYDFLRQTNNTLRQGETISSMKEIAGLGDTKYRQVDVGPGAAAIKNGIKYLSHEAVDTAMNDYVNWFNDSIAQLDQNPDPALVMITAARARQQFVSIHPFGDGNGRESYLMSYLIMNRYGLLPPTFELTKGKPVPANRAPPPPTGVLVGNIDDEGRAGGRTPSLIDLASRMLDGVQASLTLRRPDE
ncbi:MAG: Fic family protein [Myxococcota bacterium]